MVLYRGMAVPAMQSSALGASYPPLQIGATHRLVLQIGATHRLVHRLVLSRDMAFPATQSSALGASYPPLQNGATHRLDDKPPFMVYFPPIGATHRLGLPPVGG
jgi:hypothetical protein